jgi:serine/threonine protein kinase
MDDLAYPDALLAHHRLHWYVLERVLGQGGFGITYLARDTNLDQQVAIKEYLPGDVATRRPDGTVRARTDAQRERYRWGLDRFIREARTLARFDHPNIVRVLSVFELNETAYMVMRFEAGDNLGAALERRGVLPEDELLRIMLPVLDGLELVHNAGFIHRDIKPDNIHIRDDGTPVLLDFGSARHSLGKSRTLTILVAPGYAPFEQYYSSSEDQGPWTDIYGLGATCYRAIAGTAPLDSIARSKGVLGSAREILVPAKVIGKGRYSDRLLAAVDHALEFAEKDRPQTVAEWRSELGGQSGVPAPAIVAQQPAARSGTNGNSPPREPVPSHAVSAAIDSTHHSAKAAGASDEARARSSNARTRMAWAAAGAAAAAVVTFLLLTRAPDRSAEQKIAETQQQLEAERARLLQERKLDEQKRQLDEQERQRRQEQQAKDDAARVQAEPPPKAVVLPPKPKSSGVSAKPPIRDEPVPSPKIAPQIVPALVPSPPEPVAVIRPKPDMPPAAPSEKSVQSAQQDKIDEAEKALASGDFAKAREILTPIAARGNAIAQVKLAEMYANGRGVARNNTQAYIWYSHATRCGNAAAAGERAKIAAKLQAPEVEQADKAVAGMKICS